MKNADKNRDPERAAKRAASDLRCAAKKLGMSEALRVLRELAVEQGEPLAVPAPQPAPSDDLGGFTSRSQAKRIAIQKGGQQ